MKIRSLTFALLAIVLSSPTACAPARPRPADPAEIQALSDWFARQYGLVQDPRLVSLVDRVSNRLSAGLLQLAVLSDTKIHCRGNFEVMLLDTPEIAALSVGDRKIFLTRGLLRTLDSESQLAAVLAHEMAHSALGHHLLREVREPRSKLPQLHLAADEEFAADALSLNILSAAQYDPAASAQALSNLYREIGRNVSAPETALIADRLARLRDNLYASGHNLFTTQNTREFQELKARL